jgi:DNA-binding NarL/FixJ family response regulator
MSRESSLRTLASRDDQMEAATRNARARLGSPKSERVWAEGLEMSTAAALEYALGDGAGPSMDLVDAGPLTRREREVAQMVAAGLTNKQIAERLFIAERTAEGHVERIRNKLGVRSRTEVATWAVEHGASRQPLDKRAPESKV